MPALYNRLVNSVFRFMCNSVCCSSMCRQPDPNFSLRALLAANSVLGDCASKPTVVLGYVMSLTMLKASVCTWIHLIAPSKLAFCLLPCPGSARGCACSLPWFLLHALCERHSTNAVFFFQDESSYVAGERAALLRAFRETLPSQQALGSLFHAVQHLTKRMDQEGNDVHQVRHALWVTSQAVFPPFK